MTTPLAIADGISAPRVERQRRSVFQPRVALGATLGLRPGIIEPQRGSVLGASYQACIGLNPFRVQDVPFTVSQGSRCAPTLGWWTESRWDSQLAEFWKLEKDAEKMLEGLANQ